MGNIQRGLQSDLDFVLQVVRVPDVLNKLNGKVQHLLRFLSSQETEFQRPQEGAEGDVSFLAGE